MDLTTIKTMSEEKYMDVLDDLIWNDPDFVANVFKGHSTERHTEKSDVELIVRNIKENKSASTVFSDGDTFRDSIQDALVFEEGNIVSWMMKSRKEFDNPRDYNEFTICMDLKGEPVGYGYKANDLSKYEITGIRTVLQRDFSGESPMGFYIKTAFPDIQWSKDTGYKYPIENLSKDGNGLLTPMERLFAETKLKHPETLCKLQYVDGNEQLRVAIPVDKVQTIVAYYTKDKYDVKLLDCDHKKNIRPEEIFLLDKDIAATILNIEKDKRDIIENKPAKNKDEKCVAKDDVAI